MTIYRRLNQAGFGGNYTTWWLLKTMIDAGWTVEASGSGTGGLYASSNIFDPAQSPKYYTILDPNNVGIGSEPWGHPGCWYLVQDPAGNRQYTFQRSLNAGNFYDGTWTVQYSPGGIFGDGQTAGVDWDENTTPAADDSATLADSGVFVNNAGASLDQIACDDTPSPEGEYGVLCMEFQPTNSLRSVFLVDDLRNAPVGHPHALVNYVMVNADRLSLSYYHATTTQQSPGTVTDFGGNAQRYLSNAAHNYWYGYTSVGLPGNGGVGIDGFERAFPITIGMVGFEGYMGTSRWFRSPSVIHGYPDTANSEIYMFVNNVLVVDLLDGVTTPATI